MIKMIALVWCPYQGDNLEVKWDTVKNKWPDFIKLNKNMSSEEIGTVVGRLASISRGEDESPEITVEDTIKKIVKAECLILPGGIGVIDEENNKSILPSCCCGLEQWREWEDFLVTGDSPWMGHNPFPGIEVLADKFVVGCEEDYIDIGFEQFRECLTDVNKDLIDFLLILKNWINCLCPVYTDTFINIVDKNFNITVYN